MKKNVASQVVGCQMTTAADGSDFTGSVTCYVTGNGGTQAVGSVGAGACTHEGNGFHTYAPSQAETNYDHIGFTFKGTGAITVTVQVYPAFPQSGDAFGLIGTTGSGLTSLASAANQTAIKTKTDLLPSAAPGAAGGLFIAGSNAATAVNITGNITGNVSGSVGSVTAGVTLAAVTHTGAVIPTVSNLSNLPSIPAGWLTAAGIAASALNGKGDWNVGKTGYSLLQGFPANFASMSISVAGLVDITQAAADKVWGTTTRILTGGTNITLAKGSGITGFNDLDATGVAAATWNAAIASYGIGGSYGERVEIYLDAAVSSISGGGGGVADWTANQKTAIMAILGIPASGTTPDDPTTGILDIIRDAANAVKAKTDNLPADPADASDVAASIAAIGTKIDIVDDMLDTEMPALTVAVAAVKAKTDNLPSDPADASDIAASTAAIKADTAAIKLKTDNLPSDPADASDIALSFTGVNTKLDTIDDMLDTEMPALTATAASIQADTTNIKTRIPAALVAGRMDANFGALDGSTTALAALKRAVKTNVIGTIGVGSTTTSLVTSSLTPAGSVADQFKGLAIKFADDTTTAALRGQGTAITANTASATPTLTTTALTTAPVAGDTFAIL